MECRVDPRGDVPLLCAKPRVEEVGHPAMFLSAGKVNIMQLKEVNWLETISHRFTSHHCCLGSRNR